MKSVEFGPEQPKIDLSQEEIEVLTHGLPVKKIEDREESVSLVFGEEGEFETTLWKKEKKEGGDQPGGIMGGIINRYVKQEDAKFLEFLEKRHYEETRGMTKPQAANEVVPGSAGRVEPKDALDEIEGKRDADTPYKGRFGKHKIDIEREQSGDK